MWNTTALMKSTILLFASDPLVRSVLKETLEQAGYTVVAPATSAAPSTASNNTRPTC